MTNLSRGRSPIVFLSWRWRSSPVSWSGLGVVTVSIADGAIVEVAGVEDAAITSFYSSGI